ncbi:MAG TPA: hypothetical protein VFW49_02320 [Fluviicoccus sp.]|nr:hypothetical protein [Fluviicoccus sp.]
MKKILEIIGILASLAGLIGVSLTMILDDSTKSWIALAVFCSAVFFACFQLYQLTKKTIEQRYPNGYLSLSAFVRYVTSDGDNITYEVFRHIQVKRPVMSFFKHKFSWSGTKDPQCESDLQNVTAPMPIPGETTRALNLKFKNPRVYNDVEIVHLRMKLDDSDHNSSPFLNQTVTAPIRLISFRVELLHATPAYFGKMASFKRKRIENGHSAIEETLETIAFDANTKSYFHQISDPEPGYHYKLAWEKP